MDILLGSGYIDFYVDKKKFESYKTDNGKKNYVKIELDKILKSLKGQSYKNVIIRDASITTNNFWGDEFYKINDIGYNGITPKKLINSKLNKIAIRVFQIDLICVGENLKIMFINIKNENFILNTGTCKII
jgi:hypothetical protein